MTDFLLVSCASAGVCVLAMLITMYAARRAGRISVVDVTWGVTHTAVALVCATLGELLGSPAPTRRWLLVALVAIWGLRLSTHILARNAGHVVVRLHVDADSIRGGDGRRDGGARVGRGLRCG